MASIQAKPHQQRTRFEWSGEHLESFFEGARAYQAARTARGGDPVRKSALFRWRGDVIIEEINCDGKDEVSCVARVVLEDIIYLLEEAGSLDVISQIGDTRYDSFNHLACELVLDMYTRSLAVRFSTISGRYSGDCLDHEALLMSGCLYQRYDFDRAMQLYSIHQDLDSALEGARRD